jgi:hypothetical protein
MTENELYVIENLIHKAFEQYIPRIIEACKEKDELLKAQCKAHEIFSDKDNVKEFYNTKNLIQEHLNEHKEIQNRVFRRQGLILTIITIVINVIWNLIHYLFGNGKGGKL